MTDSQPFRSIRNASGLLFGASLLFASLNLASTPAVAQFASPTDLVLVNGWTSYSTSTSSASVEEENGIVHFRGAISSGTAATAFTLPAALAPSKDVYIAVDLCNATNGRLHITSAGVADIEAEGGTFANAQCFTSLEGASFAPKTSGYTALTLINGWTNGPFSTSNAEAKLIGGIVHLKGAISTTGTNQVPFVLPAAFRPAAVVYLNVDLCNATKGRLVIGTDGTATVEDEGGGFTNAPCFTSLDGAWFAPQTINFVGFSMLNGWTGSPFSTSRPEATEEYGIVYLKGAMATAGTNAEPFVLALRDRPLATVYVPVDMCDGAKGRIIIATNGVVSVQAENSFSDASCFTSLDGASFVQ